MLWSERVVFHVGEVKITFPKRLFMDAAQLAEQDAAELSATAIFFLTHSPTVR